MNNTTLQILISDGLWLVIVAGWIFLFATGLEADKPLSGGIPGHVDPADEATYALNGWRDHFGEVTAWITFGSVALLLPVVLWWIFMVHGG